MIGALPMYHSIRWGEIHTLLFKNTSKKVKNGYIQWTIPTSVNYKEVRLFFF